MPTSVVTGGARRLSRLASCEALLTRGHHVVCVDNLRDRLAREHRASARNAEFAFRAHDLTQHVAIDEPVDFVYHLASPASPIDYLRLPLQTLKVGFPRDAQRSRPREGRARSLLARVHQ